MGNVQQGAHIARLFVIDDDVDFCESLKGYLESGGFQFECAQRGEEGLERVLSGNFDLLILAGMLPGINGFEILRRLRARSRIPVLMLTMPDDDIDRIVGLEIGADDCLAKPFNPRELVARIHAVLRRSRYDYQGHGIRRYPSILAVGDVRLDSSTRTVYRNGNQVRLTALEFDLLEHLLHSAGMVVSREEIATKVLGRQLSPLDRSIDNHISRIRKKLGPRFQGYERIKTIRGVGYLYSNVPRDEPFAR